MQIFKSFMIVGKTKNIHLLYLISLLFVLLFLCACVEDDCRQCRIETYENNTLVSTGDWVEYCDQELRDVQGQTSTVGNMTTKMVCR